MTEQLITEIQRKMLPYLNNEQLMHLRDAMAETLEGNEVLTDHNLYPAHKKPLPGANMTLEGVNPSCGDDIILQLKVENGKIEDGSFVGDGCAISQASADIMLDMIIGRSVDEAKDLAETFLKMIKGEATDADIEKLEEAGALQDISHMPARVKCAVLGWHTMEKLLDHKDEQ